MSKRKSNKKADDAPDAPTVYGGDEVEKEEPKPNKKLEALNKERIAITVNLDVFLKIQGLGQNNIKKIHQSIAALQMINNDINFEERQDELKKQKKESEE